MKNLYKEAITGEEMIKITEWEIYEGKAYAYFQVKSGAKFSMSKDDVIKVS